MAHRYRRAETTVYLAAAARDARGARLGPAAVAARDGRLVAVGAPDEVRAAAGPAARVVDLGPMLLLPALVNAHAHLDLTALGPRPYAGDFVAWVSMVTGERPVSAGAIAAAVHEGLRRSRAAGVGWVGDIAGSSDAVRARIDVPPEEALPGTSYLECFGIGARQAEVAQQAGRERDELCAWAATLAGRPDVAVELQPHAPYSAGTAVYEAAACDATRRPSTHLCETLDEARFVRDAAGPFAELLVRLGKWDDSIRPSGLSPVGWLAPILARGPWLLAHCNHVDEQDLAVLAATGHTSVAYCPIASEYFGHPRHRYRDMLAAGINVCFGTDSILCQPADEPQPLGILPQMRRLYRRDRTDPSLLLAMATVNGLRALGRPPELGTLSTGAPARMTAAPFDPSDPTDPLVQILRDNGLARMVP